MRAGRRLEDGDVVPPPGDVVLTGGGMPVVDADTAAALPGRGGVLLDARAAERYRGEVEPVDPRAGHVPGRDQRADDRQPRRRRHASSPRRAAGRAVRRRSASRPGADVGVYCGSGVTAAHEVAALAAAGIEAALWPGSWSQWSADPERPVATGG